MDTKADAEQDRAQRPARRRVVTIHDVARHAGVSSMTVSRVMTGKRYVSDAMRSKVEASIKALNYSPNLTARSFSSAIRIGALYSSPNSSNLGAFMMGAYKQGGESGCQISFESGLSLGEAVLNLQQMIEAGVGSVILPPPLCDSETLLELVRTADVLPIAFASALPPDGVSAIIVDDYKGAHDMTRHLIGLGHRQIAFIQGDPAHSPSHRREQGYRAAMSAASIIIDERWVVPGMFTYKSGLEAAEQLLAIVPRPTAIFASNDAMAAAATAVSARVGLRVPEDISVAGFDDAPIASVIWPELTTIRQPIAEMAAKAVALANEQLRLRREGREGQIFRKRVALKLIERASTGPAPSSAR
jgi:LacI family transcriptional regulator